MQTVRLVSKFNLYGFVRQDKNKRYMLSCLLWAVELLFRSLSHFLVVLPLGGQQKKCLHWGGRGAKNTSQLEEKQLMQSSTSAERRPVEKKTLEHLTQQQQLGCKLHSSSHRRAGCEGHSGAIKCNLVRKQCNLQKAMQTVVEQPLQTNKHSITPTGRCPCSFLHFLLFRQVVKKCYCWVLTV